MTPSVEVQWGCFGLSFLVFCSCGEKVVALLVGISVGSVVESKVEYVLVVQPSVENAALVEFSVEFENELLVDVWMGSLSTLSTSSAAGELVNSVSLAFGNR